MFTLAKNFSLLAIVLTACAPIPTKLIADTGSAVIVAKIPTSFWHDAQFNYEPTIVKESAQTLFELDDSVHTLLTANDRRSASNEQRLKALLAQLYGDHGISLSYTSGHTTGAMQTWQDRRGDCLSLTIMVYAATRYLGVPAQMQEVKVPMTVERQSGIDFINRHVNVLVPNAYGVLINGRSIGSGAMVIDFELQPGSKHRGQPLNEAQILARFYNNRGAQYLASNETDKAYAYYRAAIQADATFAPAYANLAKLYFQKGKADSAEQLLRHAIGLQTDAYEPLRALNKLLTSQNRIAEAQVFADQLRKRQDEDPYYWLGIGLDALNTARNPDAIRALERAATLATGFEEIHFNLALAYWRNGQPDAAKRQLVALTAIDNEASSVAVLSKKLQSNFAK